MNKVIVAPDSYKESLEALDVAKSMEQGIYQFDNRIKITKLPMSDGGEGLIDSLVYATEGNIFKCRVTDPLGNKVTAKWGLLGDGQTAVIEMAEASGLQLVPPEKRDPKITTTYGTGELIKAALDQGITQLVVGIGGSATNDGGIGMTRALGGEFFDFSNTPIGTGGQHLTDIEKIDLDGLDPRVSQVNIKVACDVNNPLTGTDGASYVFAPQKGADEDDVEILDKALTRLNDVIEKQLKNQVANTPGAGAAGGMGVGLIAFFDAQLISGIDLVMETIDFENQVKSADLIITGEGTLDSQTLFGKVPYGVAKKGYKYNVPVVVLAGNIKENLQEYHDHGITAYFSTVPGPMDKQDAFDHTDKLIKNSVQQIIRLFDAGQKK